MFVLTGPAVCIEPITGVVVTGHKRVMGYEVIIIIYICEVALVTVIHFLQHNVNNHHITTASLPVETHILLQ